MKLTSTAMRSIMERSVGPIAEEAEGRGQYQYRVSLFIRASALQTLFPGTLTQSIIVGSRAAIPDGRCTPVVCCQSIDHDGHGCAG